MPRNSDTTRTLRSTKRIRSNYFPQTPQPVLIPDDPPEYEAVTRSQKRLYEDDYAAAHLLDPPPTPTPVYFSKQTLHDALDLDDDPGLPAFDNKDPGPASVASLDTPNNSPLHDAMETSNYNMSGFANIYSRSGPNLSESDSSEEEVTVPAPKVPLKEPTPPVTRTRKRRLSTSPAPESYKSTHSETVPEDRPGSSTKRALVISSSSSSSSSSSACSASDSESEHEFPRTPCPVIEGRRSPEEAITHRFPIMDFANGEQPLTPRPRITRNTRGRVATKRMYSPPKTPSPRNSVERSTPPPGTPQRERSLSPFVPPPTPRVPKLNSPGPSVPQRSSKRIKKEKTNYQEQEEPSLEPGPSNQVAIYKPTRKGKAVKRKSNEPFQTKYDFTTPGTIKSLAMENIMCYPKFDQGWCPQINQVRGENGSGKSAILTGIVLGLGGKASDTGRTSNMSNIIKTGEKSGKIEIVLHNNPSKLYGDSITIVRHISTKGSSRYQIRGSDNQMRSLSRQELDFVLSKLNIQVANPLSILHQELSRNLMRGKEPDKLYENFYRALLLNDCKRMLDKAFSDITKAKKSLLTKSQLLSELRSQETDLERAVKTIEVLEQSESKIAVLNYRLTWAEVKDYEEAHARVLQKCELAKGKKEEAESQQASVANRIQDCEREIANFQKQVKALQKVVRQSKETRAQLLTNGADYRKRLNDYNISITACQGEINRNSAQQQEYLKLKKKQEQSSASTSEVLLRENSMKLMEITDELRRIDLELGEQKNELAECNTNEERADAEYATKKEEAHYIQAQIDDCKKELNALEKSKNVKYDKYGPDMNRLMDKINKEKRWRKKPRGPLGNCITVNNENWTGLVEFVLENYLDQFAVDNREDQQLLVDIIDSVYKTQGKSNPKNKRVPAVCMTRFLDTPMNIAGGIAKTDKAPTVLEVIDIVDNDWVVYNWIIDVVKVERILLFENVAAGCDFMSKEKVPATCQRGYTKDIYLLYHNPYKAIFMSRPKNQPRYLKNTQKKNDKTYQKEDLTKKIADFTEQYKVKKQELKQLDVSKASLKNQIILLNDKIRKISADQYAKKTQVTKLNLPIQRPDYYYSYEDELKGIENILNQKQDELEGHLRGKQQLGDPPEAEAVVAVDKEIFTAEKRAKDTKTKLESAEQQVASLKPTQIERSKDVELAKKHYEDCKNKVSDSKNSLDTKIAHAKKIHSRIDPKGTSSELKMQIESLRTEVQNNNDKIVNKQETIRKWKRSKETADRVNNDINTMEKLTTWAKAHIFFLKDEFDQMLGKYSVQIRTSFKWLIRKRNYYGDLVIDHDQKQLLCWVSLTPVDQKTQAMFEIADGKQKITNKREITELINSMSGGEKSFTSICFLISCWHLMDMPFSVLDEFDVYMDDTNRSESLKALMDFAATRPWLQFFIFTPFKNTYTSPPGHETLQLQLNKKTTKAIQNGEKEEPQDNKKRLRQIKAA